MKQQGVLPLPPGWDACLSQDFPSLAFNHTFLTIHQYPFLLLGGERYCEIPSGVTPGHLYTQTTGYYSLLTIHVRYG